MNAFEIERTLYVGVATAIVFCFFGLVIGVLARLKGYSFLAWFGTGGAIIFSAVVLAFQPKVRGVAITEEERSKKVRTGNGIGWILSLAVYLLISLTVAAWLIAVSFDVSDPEEFVQRFYVAALQWTNWPWLVANLLMFGRFLCMPRGSRSWIITAAFTLLAIRLAWHYVAYWVQMSGLVADQSGPTWQVLDFIFGQAPGVSTLLLCFVATDPRPRVEHSAKDTQNPL